LRDQYNLLFGVADGDIPADVILDRLINLPIGSHAQAVDVINIIMVPSIIVTRANAASVESSDLSSHGGGSSLRDPGHPPADVADDNTVHHERLNFLHAHDLDSAENFAQVGDSVGTYPLAFLVPEHAPDPVEHAPELPELAPVENFTGRQPEEVDNSVDTNTGTELERDSNESEGSEPQKKKSRTT
jgi:hypothetical protein